MAKKHSNRKAAGMDSRKKQASDYFDRHWLRPGHPALARENFLAYCAILARCAGSVNRLVTDLLRAGREMPTLQAVALPAVLHDSVFIDTEEAWNDSALRGSVERLLELLPEAHAAAYKLDRDIFDFVEKLTDHNGDEALRRFVVQRTGLATLAMEDSVRDQLELTTHSASASLAHPARASAKEKAPPPKRAA